MFITPMNFRTDLTLARALNELDRMENTFFTSAASPFATDIIDAGESYRLEIELPGFAKEEIKVALEGKYLTVSAKHEEKERDESENKDETAPVRYIRRERKASAFSRSFSITGIDTEAIAVSHENGILSVILPKNKPVKPEVKEFTIQ